MANIRAYTTIEQSRKLAEILPFESADMFYDLGESRLPNVIYGSHNDFKCYLPCWSLAALLEIIKKLVGYSLQSLDTHTVFMKCELGGKPYNIETENYNNPVDACVEMVTQLHELDLL